MPSSTEIALVSQENMSTTSACEVKLLTKPLVLVVVSTWVSALEIMLKPHWLEGTSRYSEGELVTSTPLFVKVKFVITLPKVYAKVGTGRLVTTGTRLVVDGVPAGEPTGGPFVTTTKLVTGTKPKPVL